MKKLSATSKRPSLHAVSVSRRLSLFAKLSLGTAMAMLLSSGFPVVASNLAITAAKNMSQNAPEVSYPKGSHGSIVFSGDDDFCGVDHVTGRGGSAPRSGRIISVEEEYQRFAEYKTVNGVSPYSQSLNQQRWSGDGRTSGGTGYMGASTGGDTNIMPEAYGIYSFATGCGSSATGNYSVAFGANATARTGGSQAFGVAALASGKVTVAIGVGAEASGDAGVAFGGLTKASGEHSVAIGEKAKATGKFGIAVGNEAEATKEDSMAIGRMAHALGKSSVALGSEYNVKSEHGDNDYTTANGDYSTALGAVSKAMEYGTTAVGHRAYAMAKHAVSVGFYSEANAEQSIALGVFSKANAKGGIAIGYDSKVNVDGGIAIGNNSVSNRAAGVFGYTPILQGPATNTESQWKSTVGAFSVGDGDAITRQITGVAAGSKPSDAVNLRQLQDLEEVVRKNGWKLSVDGKNAKTVLLDSDVDFSTGSNNLQITKGQDDNKVKFDLAKNITLESVTAGANTFDATGLKIAKGPQITTAGINAGNKKITNVATGTNETDAVNFGQLKTVEKDIKDQVTASSFVKQDANTRHITIGKKTDGDKIDITNNKSEQRTLTGIKAGDISENSKEAVTGSQLFATNKNVKTVSDNFNTAATNIAKSFGGGASYRDGRWFAPEFRVRTVKNNGQEYDATYKNVADALSGVGSSIINVQNKITKKINDAITNVNDTITNVKADALLWSERDNAFVALHGKGFEEEGGEPIPKLRGKITSLLDGNISSGSTDAITGGQLYSMSNTLATYFGGGAGYKDGHKDGQWTSPTFTLKTVNGEGKEEDATYHNVAEALTGVGTSFTNVQNKITQQINNAITNVQGDSLIKKDKETNYITIGKEVAGDEINIANSSKADRTLSGVKDAVQNNEAVNKGQLDDNLKKLSESLQSDDSAVVHYNKKNDGKIDYTNVTFGKGKGSTPVALHNIANGDISESSLGAINGQQMYKIGKDVSKVLGGNASFENGTLKEPVYSLSSITVDGESSPIVFTNIGSAFSGLDMNIKNVNKRIEEVSQEVAKDSLNWNNSDNAFVASHGEGETRKDSKITHILDGNISEDSTDAITGKQLYSMSNTLATYFGGGAKYEDGKWTDPTFTVQTVKDDGQEETTTYKNVADALSGVGSSITNVQNKVTEQVNNAITAVKDDALLWSETDKAFSAQHGKDDAKTNSKITHLLDGNIASDSTDAITGKQLYSMSNTLATYFGGGAGYKDGQWTAPTFRLKTVNGEGKEEDKTYKNVAEALTGVGTSFTNVQNKITQQINNAITNVQGDSLIKKDKETNYITIGKEVEGNEINIANSSKADRTLSGVKAATKDNEAVNKGQLQESLKKLSDNLQSDESAVVHYDKDDKNGTINYTSVTLGGKEKKSVALHNVADGSIAKDSHDAITGGQINKIGEDIAKSLGGEASFKNGVLTQPTYKLSYISKDGGVTESKFQGVGTAFAGLDANIKNVNDRIKEVTQSVAQDSLSWSKTDNAFNAQHGNDGAKTNSKITHLLDGNIVAGSTDAVTGNQLHSLGDKVATYFGGAASYENGVWVAPSFKVNTVNAEGQEKNETYHNVAEALTGVGTSFTNIKNEITNQITHLQSDDSAVVHYDKKDNDQIDYASITLGGKDKTFTVLHNVADGAISSASHDAINGGQINKIGEDIAKFLGGEASFKDGTFTEPTYNLSYIATDGTVSKSSYQGVGTAFAGLDLNIKNVNDRIKEVSQGIAQDSLLWSKSDNAFSALHGKDNDRKASKITHLSDGNISSGSTDAVTGNQLYSLNKQFATYFGGGAGYNEKGEWQAPNFKINTVKEDGNSEERNYTNVAEALTGVGTSFTNIKNEITNQITHLQSEDSAVVHYDKKDDKTDYTNVTLGGKDKVLTALHNVSAGIISENSHDAINGGQVHKITDGVAKILGGGVTFREGSFTEPTYTLSSVDEQGNVKKDSFKTVGSAFEGLDKNIKNVNQRIKEVSEGVAQDSLNWSAKDNAFVAQHGEEEKTNSKIKYLASGDISAASTEAVNGSQLHSLGDKVASYFGGGASYENGTWVAPIFKVKTVKEDGNSEEQEYKNVSAAFEGVGTSFTNIKNEITNQINHLQSEDSAVVHYNKKDDG
ncbi:hypothetical protein, partial [Bartonella sp. ML70XJBT.G]